jgi:RNA polymerase-binding transcription factor DksA
MDDLNKLRYSDEELEEFRVLIQEKIDKAMNQLNFYNIQIDELTNGPDGHIKGLDDGVATSETEHLMQMMARTKKHIKHLESALVRIDNKAYGICRISGKLISKERLRAVPHATLSVEAKESMKRF